MRSILAFLLVAAGICLPPTGDSSAQRMRYMAPPATIEMKADEAVIPMDFSALRATVQVYVDGQGPYPFVFDTGAPGTVIDAALAEELGLEVVGKVRIGDPSGKNPLPADRVKTSALKVGDLQILDLTVTAIPLEGRFESAFLGVLGYPHFADYLIIMDYPGKSITIRKGELEADGSGVVEYRSPHGLIELDVEIAGESFAFHLDSGSSGGIGLTKEKTAGLKWLEDPTESRTAKTVNNEFTVYRGRLDGAVRFAGMNYENPEIEFAEGIRGSTIGQKILEDLVVTIDQQNERLRFVPKARTDEDP
jgi:predicted aspartyl protease